MVVLLVEQVSVPARARELAGLDSVDYADAFSVPVAATRSPEAWIRLADTELPAMFAAVRVAHRTLGLRLARSGSPGHLMGWEVLTSDPDAVVLGAAGTLGTPRIVGLTLPGHLVVATLISLNGLPGRALWAGTGPVHRAVARYILRRTAAASVATGA
jgi:hypothetical protein